MYVAVLNSIQITNDIFCVQAVCLQQHQRF